MQDEKARLLTLDGLRGIAALWVLAGHSLNLSGAWIPIIGRPLLAVDLFMMLSGALMLYQADRRQDAEPMEQTRTWLRFWIRRFFRIAPLFYLVFVVAMMFAPLVGEARELIWETRGIVGDSERYDDRSLTNIVLHLSFLFAFLPGYAERSPLPDWSIGLEMQFYFFFPLIFLACRRIGLAWAGIALTAFAAAFCLVFWDFVAAFPQPAFLALKLPIFLAGMLLMRARATRSWLLFALAILLVAVPVGPMGHWSETVVRVMLALTLGLTLQPGFAGPLAKLVGDMLELLFANRVSRFLGDISYGVYLIHLPVLVVVVSLLLELTPMDRAFAAAAVTTPIVFALAYLCFRLVEKPGIALGRSVLGTKPRDPMPAPPMT